MFCPAWSLIHRKHPTRTLPNHHLAFSLHHRRSSTIAPPSSPPPPPQAGLPSQAGKLLPSKIKTTPQTCKPASAFPWPTNCIGSAILRKKYPESGIRRVSGDEIVYITNSPLLFPDSSCMGQPSSVLLVQAYCRRNLLKTIPASVPIHSRPSPPPLEQHPWLL